MSSRFGSGLYEEMGTLSGVFAFSFQLLWSFVKLWSLLALGGYFDDRLVGAAHYWISQKDKKIPESISTKEAFSHQMKSNIYRIRPL